MHPLTLLATLVDFCGTVVIFVGALACLRDYARGANASARTDDLRLRLAQSLVTALTFKTGACLIRTSTIATLAQLKGVLVIIALRFLLGRVLKGQLARRPLSPRPRSDPSWPS